MFGLFRYGLAVLVVVGHTWPQLAAKPGTYAVFAFYLLSGYLIARVLAGVYGFGRAGLGQFAMNRCLRLFPLYWVVAAATLIVLAILPGLSTYDSAIRLPSDGLHWLVNVTVLGLVQGIAHFHMSGERLASVAWSLHVDLVFYLLMPLLARNARTVMAWLAASLLYPLYMVVADYSWQDRYFTLLAASLPFSLGAALYHFGGRVTMLPGRSLTLLLPLSFMLHALCSTFLYGEGAAPMGLGFYLSAVLSLHALTTVDGGWVWWRRVDNYIGELSYPLYLLHQLIAAVLFAGLAMRRSAELFGGVLLLFTLISIALHEWIERPENRLRDRIRGVQAVGR